MTVTSVLRRGGLATAAAGIVLAGFTGTAHANNAPYLRYGATGEGVSCVQTALEYAGFGNVKIDGIWGGQTQSALVQFQRNNGLKPDGIVGPDTGDAILKEIGAPPRWNYVLEGICDPILPNHDVTTPV